jgi:hypothetical protein
MATINNRKFFGFFSYLGAGVPTFNVSPAAQQPPGTWNPTITHLLLNPSIPFTNFGFSHYHKIFVNGIEVDNFFFRIQDISEIIATKGNLSQKSDLDGILVDLRGNFIQPGGTLRIDYASDLSSGVNQLAHDVYVTGLVMPQAFL